MLLFVQLARPVSVRHTVPVTASAPGRPQHSCQAATADLCGPTQGQYMLSGSCGSSAQLGTDYLCVSRAYELLVDVKVCESSSHADSEAARELLRAHNSAMKGHKVHCRAGP